MIVFRTNNLLICVISLFIFMAMSVLAATEVHANIIEKGYVTIDRGTHKAYIPETDAPREATGAIDLDGHRYLLPELEEPAMISNQEPFPENTYETRTIYEGLSAAETNYIPVNFIVDSGDQNNYYSPEYFSNLANQNISFLNTALNEYETPGVDTFVAAYHPNTETLHSSFPAEAPNQITLLLNHNSRFAQGLTLDVEEWWRKDDEGTKDNGGTARIEYWSQIGLTVQEQQMAALTHGSGVTHNVNYGATAFGLNFGGGHQFEYTSSSTNQTMFSRTVSEQETVRKIFELGADNTQDYRYAIYKLITRVKVNYADAPYFSELQQAMDNIDDFGLRLDMNSYIQEMATPVYHDMTIPIVPERPDFDVPQLAVYNVDYGALTAELRWTQSSNVDLQGYLVYKNDAIVEVIRDPSRTSWIDRRVVPGEVTDYYVRTFRSDTIDGEEDTKIVSEESNRVSITAEVTPAMLGDLVVGCSIPFVWGVGQNQIDPGERTYYKIYIGDPSIPGSSTFLGSYEGTSTSINLSAELYDELLVNPNEDFYIVREALINGQPVSSAPTRVGNDFTVTDTAFLFSNAGFNGDCITVSKDQFITDLGEPLFNFDNKLSSMLVQGNVMVEVFDNYGDWDRMQSIFTEDGFAQVPDFEEKVIGSDIVSAIRVQPQTEGVYLFPGEEYYGLAQVETYRPQLGYLYGHEEYELPRGNMANNDIQSVKVVGSKHGVVLYDDDFGGRYSFITENWADPIAIPADGGTAVGDNAASSYKILWGKGVWFCKERDFNGWCEARQDRWDCPFSDSDRGCSRSYQTWQNDSLSSVLVIGDYAALLYQHRDYGGRVQVIKRRDSYLGSSGNVGDNAMSSFKILSKGVYLFDDRNYGHNGLSEIHTAGEWRTIEDPEVNFPDNSLSSIIAIGYRARLYPESGFGGTSETETKYDPDLSDNPIGENTVSSIKVEALDSSRPVPPSSPEVPFSDSYPGFDTFQNTDAMHVTGMVQDGSPVYQLTSTAPSDNWSWIRKTIYDLWLSSGDSYEFGVWLKTADGSPSQEVTLMLKDDLGNGTGFRYFTATDQWVYHSIDYTFSSGSTKVDAYIYPATSMQGSQGSVLVAGANFHRVALNGFDIYDNTKIESMNSVIGDAPIYQLTSTAPSNEYSSISQFTNIRNLSEKTVRLGAWLKTADGSASQEVRFIVRDYSNNSYELRDFTITNQWEYYSIDYSFPINNGSDTFEYEIYPVSADQGSQGSILIAGSKLFDTTTGETY
ncbi:hypothetical protein [Chengkuizengella sediminis]|uniref:hypothetical protein n=1 Tax=Chengkuizengella sediminis TaxID=1885917 RepID=UPI001389A155|nr:hypothetical protein [Chengkuizengella sediminis]NDI34633.1 hypothetical protein [Chengkuizengella sediminis]